MIYTVDQLIHDFRSDVYDHADVDDAGMERDVLWSTQDVLRYINAATAKYATDTLGHRRRFEFDVAVGDPLIRFPLSEILDELQITFSVPGLGRRRLLRQFDLDTGIRRDDYGSAYYAAPDLEATGTPSHWTRDYDDQFIRLWPSPAIAGVFQASAIAIPMEVRCGMPLPFQNRVDREMLLLWMKHLAYAKQDADTLDLARSNEFRAQYEVAVRDRASLFDRLRRDNAIMRPN